MDPDTTIVSGISPDEVLAHARAAEEAFGAAWNPADDAAELAIAVPERSMQVRRGAEILATTGSFYGPLVVPGGVALPCAAVTNVTARIDARRRGLTRELLTRQLAEAHERGEVLAALWATEPGIYGRFGYGPATTRVAVELARGSGLELDGAGVALSVADPHAVRPVLDEAFRRLAVPGCTLRDESLWNIRLHERAHDPGHATRLRAVLAGDPAAPAGYALFRQTNSYGDNGMPAGTVQVEELLVGDPVTAAALWGWLLDVDLTASVVARRLGPGDPLFGLLRAPRAAGARLADGLWVRPVDLAAALTGRAWFGALDLVLRVADRTCPWNAGTWRLTADVDGAELTRTTGDAALELDVSLLGATLLGGTTLRSYAQAGRLAEHRAGAVAAFDRAARGEVEPWAPMVF